MRKFFSLKRTRTCLILLGTFLILGSFYFGLIGKLFTAYSRPVLYEKRKEMELVEDIRSEHSENILVAPPNSSLGYPIYGVQVMPLYTINLPGLQIIADLPTYTV